MARKPAMIHPTALIEDGAKLGAGVEIGPFCHVGPHAVLEDGVRLLSHAEVKGVTRIGTRTVVHPGAVLGGEGQIRGNDFPEGRLAFGDHAELACLYLIGLKRRGLPRETINALRAAFRASFYGVGGDIISRAM